MSQSESTKRKAEDPEEEVTKKAKKVEEVVAEEEVNKFLIQSFLSSLRPKKVDGSKITSLCPFLFYFYQVLLFTIILIIAFMSNVSKVSWQNTMMGHICKCKQKFWTLRNSSLCKNDQII